MKTIALLILFTGAMFGQGKLDKSYGVADSGKLVHSFGVGDSRFNSWGINFEPSYQFPQSKDSTKVTIQDKTIRTKENPYLIAPVLYTVQLWDEYKKSLDDKYNKRLNEWVETINLETRFGANTYRRRTCSITIDPDGWTNVQMGKFVVDTFNKDIPTFEGFIEYLRNKE